MKNSILLIFASVISFSASAQFGGLPDGSIAPDFTLIDEDGNTHNLYDLLDDGKTVFLDLFAVWCPPCWDYKLTGAMEDLYVQHGPAGYPGVDANTTDDVMVFAIEADGNLCSCLPDAACNVNSQGDWLTGTSHPTICMDGSVNVNTIAPDYATGFFWPYIYRVCPDRTTTLIGSPANPYSLVGGCASGIESVEPTFTISPNPAVNTINIELTTAEEVQIFDAAGRTVFTNLNTESNLNIDISQYAKGIYTIKVGSKTAKFIKK
ncbi:MAG TPA: T9SS type A sorting domain-containing protein [Flavobacteriales bacterium]|jgi:hypothetical protein|nr:T9SS type A sorting domain-containing protein [Flavobacteriales bacterium]